MSAQLPDGARAYSQRLTEATDSELDAIIERQLVEDPELVLALAEAFAFPAATSWRVDVALGASVDNEAAYIEVPFDEATFFQAVLGQAAEAPALIRLNVRPDDHGSDLDVEMLLPGTLQPGVRIRCAYDVEGDDVVLEAGDRTEQLLGRSRTSQLLTAQDAVVLRLSVEHEADAVA